MCRELIRVIGCLGFLLFFSGMLYGQSFTRLTIDEEIWHRDASWSDYDNDGDLDLFFAVANIVDTENSHDKLFRNDGNDLFTDITPASWLDLNAFSSSPVWADYDNDGLVDVYVCGTNAALETTFGSLLQRNQGDGAFDIILSGDIGAENTISSAAAAWADYNNDGYVDLFVATNKLAAYPGDTLSNVLFDNSGDGSFSRNLGSELVNGAFDQYSHPTWSDIDLDGDMDLFIPVGRANGDLVRDFVYINQLQETGNAGFVRDTLSAFGGDARDASLANFIDYDNDGDLDVFITNFGGAPPAIPPAWPGMANDLYRNEGGGYLKISSGTIVTDTDISAGQTWGDFDNDGDLDLYVCNGTSQFHLGGNKFYRNSGYPDYTFSSSSLGDMTASGRASDAALTADYDNDGDLDVYVRLRDLIGNLTPDALYRNDTDNGNNWVNITGEGLSSNRSAIGAQIRAKATIFGNTYWQMREIAGHDAFGGQSSLRIHFGLGDAAVIDSLLIVWPSGIMDVYEEVAANQFYTASEGESITTGIDDRDWLEGNVPTGIYLEQNYPNPFNPQTTINYDLSIAGMVSLIIYDISGRQVKQLAIGNGQTAGSYTAHWDGTDDAGQPVASGLYLYRLVVQSATRTNAQERKMILLR